MKVEAKYEVGQKLKYKGSPHFGLERWFTLIPVKTITNVRFGVVWKDEENTYIYMFDDFFEVRQEHVNQYFEVINE